MTKVVTFRDLDVWNKSMLLTEQVYALSRKLPREELYGLVSQIRRAVISIPSNIAEGYGIGGASYHRHIMIARGSLMELEVQLELAVRLNLIKREEIVPVWPLLQDVGQMLTKLAASLRDI